MGCSCSSSNEVRPNIIQEALADPARYCAYPLPVTDPDCVLIYDFQSGESRIAKIAINIPLEDYSVHINHPLFFVAGGVEKGTNTLSNKIWVTSAGSDMINMANFKEMDKPRKKPFIFSVQEGAVHIVGGYEEGDKISKQCDKFQIGEDVVKSLNNMSYENDYIVGLEHKIYGFGKLGSRNQIEIFDSTNELNGWEIIAIRMDNNLIKNRKNFGVLARNGEANNIVIFGGTKEDNIKSGEVFEFDSNVGDILPAKNCLPNPEAFYGSTTSGKDFGYALSLSFAIYKYDKNMKYWTSYSTSTLKEIEKKQLKIKN